MCKNETWKMKTLQEGKKVDSNSAIKNASVITNFKFFYTLPDGLILGNSKKKEKVF